jgi:hypothetical protein
MIPRRNPNLMRQVATLAAIFLLLGQTLAAAHFHRTSAQRELSDLRGAFEYLGAGAGSAGARCTDYRGQARPAPHASCPELDFPSELLRSSASCIRVDFPTRDI